MGWTALAAFKKIDRDVPVIMLSGQGRTDDGRTGDEARRARTSSASRSTKPISMRRLTNALQPALSPRREVADSTARRASVPSTAHDMLFGTAASAWPKFSDLIDRVADTDVTVLIRGE